MDFTREPIIESVVTPKDGCKLVVRSSKASSQEEFFVDSVEVVSFGNSFFFRSLERPKSFLVPASDYELLEVRETRLVLKNVGLDRTIKIGGGREPKKEKEVEAPAKKSEDDEGEARVEKKREKRRQTRRKRTKQEVAPPPPAEQAPVQTNEGQDKAPAVEQKAPREGGSSLLPPPPTLISETIARYKDNALFKDAFFLKEEDDDSEEETQPQDIEDGSKPAEEEFPSVSLPQPEYGSFELSEEEEEEIYRQRTKRSSEEEVPVEDVEPSHEEIPQPLSEEADLPPPNEELIGENEPSSEHVESNNNISS